MVMPQTATARRGTSVLLLLATTLPATFLGPPWPWQGSPSTRRSTWRGALGFGAEDQKPTLDEAVKGVVEKVEKLVNDAEDETLQRAIVQRLSKKGNLTTLNLINQAKITLVGVNHLSREAAEWAERQVRKNNPSALVLELCPERINMLILGRYREASRKSLMKPEESDALRRAHAWHADEVPRSFDAFMGTGSGQLMVLGDLKASFIENQVPTIDDVTRPDIRTMRDLNLALNIFQTVLLGHHCVLAILGANHLVGVEQELRAFNDRFATIGGNFSEAASTFGKEMWLEQPMPTGFYIPASGCKQLQERRKKLQDKVPVDKWRKRKNQESPSCPTARRFATLSCMMAMPRGLAAGET